ncbi:MAG: glycosyltransferase family 1 protein [Xanthomonadales bacterium]|nr:glycosyltransferase family 1 protein [Xanthomonadales bacterium]
MRVGLDISQAVKRKVRGIARYIREILPHLLAQSSKTRDGFEPALYVRGDRIFRKAPLADLAPGAPVRWLPARLYLPGRGLDLFHSFGNYLPAYSPVPLTFTAHDFRALDLDAAPPGSRLHRNVARSAGVICLTEHGRSRLLHHFPDYEPGRLAVVPHGVDHDRFRPREAAQALATASRHGLRPPYILQLGSWFPHKNLELSVRAFAESRARREGLRLAFVGGGASQDYRRALDELAGSLGVRDQIDWVEDVPADDIPAVLAASSCLLQPSRYEGFALPLLEAMAVGTPGVVSDSSCLPEVTGGAWPVVAQDNAEALAQELDALVFDEARRAITISAGLARASQFTWAESARKTLTFFRHVAGLGAKTSSS